MAGWCVEKLDRIADTPIAFLLPFRPFFQVARLSL
jgi:hypothetical protein